MTAQITKTSFSCELVTIHSKRSFADLISRIEATFRYYEPKTLRDLTAEGDTEKLAAYVKQVGEPTEFAIFFSRPRFDAAIGRNTDRIPFLPVRECDHRPRSLPVFSTRRSWSAGALLRVTKRWRRCTHRHRSSNFVLQPISRDEGFTGSSDIG